MTVNVRHATDPSPNSWEERLPLLEMLLKREAPDIVTTQECFYGQVKDMLTVLPGYDWLGLGRKGGSGGEYMAIFYRKDRFELLEYDHYWLSATPNVIGSVTWGNAAPRMVTWGRFHDRETKRSFYLCNTHFDHKSPESRVLAAQLMVERAKSFDPELPVIIAGDFNVGPDSEAYGAFTREGGFTDTWLSSGETIGEGLGTFNNFNNPAGRGPSWRIDWILTRGPVAVQRIQIVSDIIQGRFPSDHYPLVAELQLS